MKKVLVCFELHMPGVNTWNGKWPGEDDYYACVERALKELDGKSFSYDFGDGWHVRIDCRKVLAPEAAKIRRKSKGFCGYEWMIRSIIKNNKIKQEARR